MYLWFPLFSCLLYGLDFVVDRISESELMPMTKNKLQVFNPHQCIVLMTKTLIKEKCHHKTGVLVISFSETMFCLLFDDYLIYMEWCEEILTLLSGLSLILVSSFILVICPVPDFSFSFLLCFSIIYFI